MNKKAVSVKRNYILSLIANILSIVVPLITTPYISRVLGANNIGIYSYCLSIETYFVILGTLGIPTYAKREIAASRNNKQKLNNTFSELLTLQVVLLLLSIIAYIVVTIIIIPDNKLMFMMCGIGIFAALFDVSWLFQGIEDFSTIVKRSIIFKAISILLIFLLVKDETGLYTYAFSLMATNLVCNLWLFINSKKIIHFKLPSFKNTLKHLKPAAFILLPSMVTAIYAVIDKTMLGAMTNNMSEVGYYEQSQKIVTVSLAVITSLGAVLMPRLTALYSQGNKEAFKKYINKGLSVLCLLSAPIAIGCIIISNSLVPWFYGEGYEKIIILLKIFAPMYIFMGISDLIGTQTLLALNKEKTILIVNIISTIINLALNAILIPKYLSYGAAVATLLSELFKCITYMTISQKYFNISSFLISLSKYLIAAMIMGVTLFLLRQNIFSSPTMLHTIGLIIIGFTIYFLEMILMRDYWIINLKKMIHKKVKKHEQ